VLDGIRCAPAGLRANWRIGVRRIGVNSEPQFSPNSPTGINTVAAKVAPAGALPCSAPTGNHLAHVATRLSDLGETESKQLINWGYAICVRCVRVHYNVAEIQQKPGPKWPYPQVPLLQMKFRAAEQCTSQKLTASSPPLVGFAARARPTAQVDLGSADWSRGWPAASLKVRQRTFA
jgi:hypothetical protein